MPASHLILCEKTPRWAPAFRAALSFSHSPTMQMIETRSLPGCEEALAASPASFVAIEITAANLEATLNFLRRVALRHPSAVVAALLSPETLAAASLLCEAGAIDIAASVLEAPRLVRLAQRHHQQAPADALSARQFVSERLPWPSYATSNSRAE